MRVVHLIIAYSLSGTGRRARPYPLSVFSDAFVVYRNGNASVAGDMDVAGNVGIGTSTPDASLQVLGKTAFGRSSNQPVGSYSTAMGSGTIAHGDWSVSMGTNTNAYGNVSAAMGESTVATGYASVAMGYYTTAEAFGSLVIGAFNVPYGDPDGWVWGDPLFIIGNGTPAQGSNAFVVDSWGDMIVSQDANIGRDADIGRNVIVSGEVNAQIVNINDFLTLNPTTEPASPAPGTVYFDSGDNKIHYFNGVWWKTLATE